MPASPRKKWLIAIAVVVVLSVTTYPLSLGPLFYLNGAGYLGDSVFDTLRATVFAPCLNLADSIGPYADYLYWWMERGADAYAARMQESGDPYVSHFLEVNVSVPRSVTIAGVLAVMGFVLLFARNRRHRP